MNNIVEVQSKYIPIENEYGKNDKAYDDVIHLTVVFQILIHSKFDTTEIIEFLVVVSCSNKRFKLLIHWQSSYHIPLDTDLTKQNISQK